MLDDALLRPGRIDRVVLVGLPDTDSRREIFSVHCKRAKLSEDVSVDLLAMSSDGYSGAEIAAVCREASLAAMTESLDATEVCQRHFNAALVRVRPQTTAAMIKYYADYRRP